LAGASTIASAASVVTHDDINNPVVDQSGTGFGTRLTLLSVANNGTESGAVTGTGGAGDVITPQATNQSATHSVAELLGIGITKDNFKLILNIAENGSGDQITLHNFVLTFTDKDGNPLKTAANQDIIAQYTAPAGGKLFDQQGNGQGASGHLFS